MILWKDLISRNRKLVQDFAVGNVSARRFAAGFPGRPNYARTAIRSLGATSARTSARKALRARGLLV